MKIDINNLEALATYLRQRKILDADENVQSAAIPGEGNMNYTIRVNTNAGSFIVKQANPYVQKYPQLAAPANRAIVEATFYRSIQNEPVIYKMMPGLLDMDEQNCIIILEDLVAAKDMTYLYRDGELLTPAQGASLATYLAALHQSFKTRHNDELMANRALRSLNHEHIFIYPLMHDNGFNLDSVQPGLQDLSLPFKNSQALKDRAAAIGSFYLADSDTLLHGDFYPGSWLNVAGTARVIDPEFSFYGSPEFDVAVMKAHLLLSEHPPELLNEFFTHYRKLGELDHELLNAFTGMEIIRRLIGLAQLPLSLSLAKKEQLLNDATSLLGVPIK